MWVCPQDVAETLRERHYLGPSKRGVAWRDEHGVVVLARPTARNVPQHWLELVRWCLTGEKNAGSKQWSVLRKAILAKFPDVTTVVSYSDPSVGHTGALYRACNWLWAPTWHRLRPPPSGNGSWSAGKTESVKDRWVFPLRDDAARVGLLVARDASVLRKYPHATYREPGGADYKAHRSLL